MAYLSDTCEVDDVGGETEFSLGSPCGILSICLVILKMLFPIIADFFSHCPRMKEATHHDASRRRMDI